MIQGRGDAEQQLLDDALAVQEAGAFAVVIEMVPADVAGRVTRTLDIPTISVGGGVECDGQMMVWTDAFGYTTGRSPKFVRKYANLAEQLEQAVGNFISDVHEQTYPSADESY